MGALSLQRAAHSAALRAPYKAPRSRPPAGCEAPVPAPPGPRPPPAARPAHREAGAPARARHSPRDPGRVVHLRRASVSPAGDRARWVRPRGGRCLRPAGPPTVSTLLPQEPSRARAAPAPTRAGAGDAGKFQRRRGSSRDAAPGGKRIRRARQTATAASQRRDGAGATRRGRGRPPGAGLWSAAKGPRVRRLRRERADRKRGGGGGIPGGAAGGGGEGDWTERPHPRDRGAARTQVANGGLGFADSRELLFSVANRRMADSGLFQTMSLDTSGQKREERGTGVRRKGTGACRAFPSVLPAQPRHQT